MKNIVLGIVTLVSFSSFAGDISLKCKGSSMVEADNFVFTEDKRLMEAEVKVGAARATFIVIENNSMKVVTRASDLINKKGAAVLYLTQATNANDSLNDGVNVFNTVLHSNAPDLKGGKNLFESFIVKSAMTYRGERLDMVDMERKFGFSCIRG